MGRVGFLLRDDFTASALSGFVKMCSSEVMLRNEQDNFRSAANSRGARRKFLQT